MGLRLREGGGRPAHSQDMRWWTLALLSLAIPATADPAADEERAKRVAAYSEEHKLKESKLYGSLGQSGYLQHTDVHASPPLIHARGAYTKP